MIDVVNEQSPEPCRSCGAEEKGSIKPIVVIATLGEPPPNALTFALCFPCSEKLGTLLLKDRMLTR